MSTGREPTEQIERPPEAGAPSRLDRGIRLAIAAVLAMMAIVLAGLLFAFTL